MTIFYQTRCCWLQQSSGSPPSGHGWTYPKRLSESSDKAENSVPIQSTACYSLNVLENLRTRLETIIFTTKNSMTTFWFSGTESWNVLVLNKVLPLHFWVLKSEEFLQANLIFFLVTTLSNQSLTFFSRTWTFWDALAKGKNSPIFLTRLTFH